MMFQPRNVMQIYVEGPREASFLYLNMHREPLQSCDGRIERLTMAIALYLPQRNSQRYGHDLAIASRPISPISTRGRGEIDWNYSPFSFSFRFEIAFLLAP